LADIRNLLGSPRKWKSAIDLANSNRGSRGERLPKADAVVAGLRESILAGSHQSIEDRDSLRATGRRLAELTEAITVERGCHTDAQLEKLEREKRELTRHMSAASGKRGRSRTLDSGDPVKNATKAVAKRIREAIESIGKQDGLGPLSEHLKATIHWDGCSVSYTPVADYSWNF